MTNDPLDPEEVSLWDLDPASDAQFPAAMRIDRILNHWIPHHSTLAAQGYAVEAGGGNATARELRRFLADWIVRMKPVYMAVSLEDTFMFPMDDVRTTLLRD